MSLGPRHIHLAVLLHELADGQRKVRLEKRTSDYLKFKFKGETIVEIAWLLDLFKANKSVKIVTGLDGECWCVFRPGFYDILKLSGKKFSTPRRKENKACSIYHPKTRIPA